MRAIDLFAGWGGFSLGAEQAGARVVYAANHWDLAVKAHALNHPQTAHVCQDLRQADWSALPAYDVLLAGPACPGHSPAGQPGRAKSAQVRKAHDALRATAWAVIDCAEVTLPRAIAVENVPHFTRWKLYPRWRGCLQDLGYHVREYELDATRYGVPQRRKRVFVIATRRAFALQIPRERDVAFGPHIQWEAGNWKPIKHATGAARDRLEAGLVKHRGKRFFGQHVSLSTKARAATGLDLSEPIRTITTKDQWFVCNGRAYRPLTVRENARAMGFSDSYGWPDGCTRRELITGLGNAVCPPVARGIVSQLGAAL